MMINKGVEIPLFAQALKKIICRQNTAAVAKRTLDEKA